MPEDLAFDMYGTLVDPAGISRRLERFADVKPGLERLKEAGPAMIVFSNGASLVSTPASHLISTPPGFARRLVSFSLH